jgi:hypothetical protein
MPHASAAARISGRYLFGGHSRQGAAPDSDTDDTGNQRPDEECCQAKPQKLDSDRHEKLHHKAELWHCNAGDKADTKDIPPAQREDHRRVGECCVALRRFGMQGEELLHTLFGILAQASLLPPASQCGPLGDEFT